MASEMSDLTPRQRAEAVLSRIVGIVPMQSIQREARIEWLLEYATTARQEALREANDLVCTNLCDLEIARHHECCAALTSLRARLAREGVK